MSLKFFDKLSQNLIELNDKNDYNKKKIFSKMKIILKQLSSRTFLLEFLMLFFRIVDLENCETRFIYDLMLAADEFELEKLTDKIETLLIETKGSWLRIHFSFIYHFIFRRNDYKKLKNFYNNIIVKYPNLIFDSSDFTSLEESAIVSLLERARS
ncbi:hypothetical protein Glove_151g32 [Diversispora epigaea]|uniref:BACK domain-containing protein n=1 Tax=Diversispora epigaea TaxID=1348612 RepID=A0A397J2J2_9GLOM|nr:hypothetical protein Glove_151g32 [Diversispora epigaea]